MEDLRKRLKVFALRIIKLTECLPNNVTGKTLGNQIIHSGISPGANYRRLVWENPTKTS